MRKEKLLLQRRRNADDCEAQMTEHVIPETQRTRKVEP
jgi:hypothetical protein